jgi:hypothetical protein
LSGALKEAAEKPGSSGKRDWSKGDERIYPDGAPHKVESSQLQTWTSLQSATQNALLTLSAQGGIASSDQMSIFSAISIAL